jgi:hypothetical protein
MTGATRHPLRSPVLVSESRDDSIMVCESTVTICTQVRGFHDNDIDFNDTGLAAGGSNRHSSLGGCTWSLVRLSKQD